jgi:hypothetical protein
MVVPFEKLLLPVILRALIEDVSSIEDLESGVL